MTQPHEEGWHSPQDSMFEHLRELTDALPIGIVLRREDGTVYFNRMMGGVTGYTPAELRDLSALERVILPQHQPLLRVATAIESDRPSSHYEVQLERKGGGRAWVDVSARRVDWRGERVQMISLMDITRYKVLEEQLIRNAMYDGLTGLPSRCLLEDRLREALAHARRTRSLLAVVLIDIHRFREINELIGSQVGDQLLMQAARRLGEMVRESDTLARGTDDDFVVVLNHLKEAQDAERVVRKLLTVFREPFTAEPHHVYLDASAGFAIYPRDGSTPEELVKNAASALTFAKNNLKDRVMAFEPAMHAMALEKLRLTNRLRQAIECGELQLYYQPLVDLRRNEVVGLEALARWLHPDAGLVFPDSFIPLAEESGLIHPLGRWVIREACSQAALWQGNGHPPLRISINISPAQFEEEELVDYIEETLALCKLEAGRLALEITERTFMGELEAAAQRLQRLRQMGAKVDIDDFGTIYASLAYLRKLPVDSLKIDRIFIQDLTGNGGTAQTGGASGSGVGVSSPLKPDPLAAKTSVCSAPALTRAIVLLGHSLNMDVVAEGVETLEQLQMLRELGCDLAQGFYFSQPVPADQALACVADINRRLTQPHG